jgi:hypothetical protein
LKHVLGANPLETFQTKRLLIPPLPRWFAPINGKAWHGSDQRSSLPTSTNTVVASVAISIALLAMTKDLRPTIEVFSNVMDGSNRNSKGFSFMIGFLSVAWTITDYGEKRSLIICCPVVDNSRCYYPYIGGNQEGSNPRPCCHHPSSHHFRYKT